MLTPARPHYSGFRYFDHTLIRRSVDRVFALLGHLGDSPGRCGQRSAGPGLLVRM
jgi:hypothetical protein